jgi:hypothetical protein
MSESPLSTLLFLVLNIPSRKFGNSCFRTRFSGKRTSFPDRDREAKIYRSSMGGWGVIRILRVEISQESGMNQRLIRAQNLIVQVRPSMEIAAGLQISWSAESKKN